MTLRRCLPLVLFVLLIALTMVPHAPTLASVEILSFEAQGQVGQIVVVWTTANEVNNVGFNLWRDTSVNFLKPTHLNNQQLIPSQCVGCIARTDYVYTDTNVAPGTYYYWLASVGEGGATDLFGPVSADAIATSSATTYPPTHTPVPSFTPTPTDTPVHTATATRPTFTPTPTGTPQPETPVATEPSATATQSVEATLPNATATLATLVPSSPTPTPTLEPERTPTPFVLTVVALTAAPSPTAARSTATLAAPTAAPKEPGASLSTPTWPARLLSPVAETPQVELWRILIGVGLIGLGAVLGLSVLGIVVYFLWRRPSRP
jgi:hypothetical protein